MNVEKIITEKAGTIVDVRSPEEFRGGSVPGSINIPLQEIMQDPTKIEDLKQPLVLCCASGNRSGMAMQFLSSHGYDCCNGGSWLDVNFYRSKSM